MMPTQERLSTVRDRASKADFLPQSSLDRFARVSPEASRIIFHAYVFHSNVVLQIQLVRGRGLFETIQCTRY